MMMTAAALPTAPGDLLAAQRAFFATGATRSLAFRQTQLKRLKAAVLEHQEAIVAAVRTDLGRPEFEAYFELGVLAELKHILKHLKGWMRPRRVGLDLSQLPGRAWVQPEPKGSVLILGPWNYPFQLVISPLMGAIAAGNCAIVKPSELAPASSQVLATLVQATFDPAYIAVVEGGVDTAQALLAERFDHIFFTGGTAVGRQVMAAAAPHLTPVTLELGGKSPCLVEPDVPLDLTAKRIVWGKFVNAGQTCIAPDYLLVHESIQAPLLQALGRAITDLFGPDPAQSPDLARIVNDRQFERLLPLLNSGTVAIGGQWNRPQRYIAPTVLNGVTWADPVMAAEIFGPILPMLTYRHLDAALADINAHPKPLALYVFSRDRAVQDRVINGTTSGGVCLNDVVFQVAAWGLPFGGIGDSGIGAYHGKASFDTFSHQRSVLQKPFWLDASWRYAPYANKLAFFKKLINAG